MPRDTPALPWHPGSIKPKSDGIYEVVSGSGHVWFSMWMEGRWGYCEPTVKQAYKFRNAGPSDRGITKWRGPARKK